MGPWESEKKYPNWRIGGIESSAMELNTRKIKEENEINLQIKNIEVEGLKNWNCIKKSITVQY